MRLERNALKMENQHLFSLYENAAKHRSVFVKNYLAKYNVTTLEHPPYSLDLVAADFYLFLQLKSTVKGQNL